MRRLVENLRRVAVDELPFGADADFTTAVGERIGSLEQDTNALQNTVSDVITGVTSPLTASRRTVALLTGMRGRAVEVRTASYTRTVVGASNETRREAVERRQVLLEALEEDVLQSVRAREGQDLRDIARAALGDEGEWRSLLIFNELASTQLTANQLVLIPSQDAAGPC